MTPIERMDETIQEFSLLESKFYQAWSAGALPVSALRTYAHEYGAFIAQVPAGWSAHGDSHTAEVEVGHIELWRQFAKGLGTDIGTPKNPEVARLLEKVKVYFSSPVESLGALYAFEVQQPKTAHSKLDGLNAHYDLVESAKTYFRVHLDDEDEVELLRERMRSLSQDDLARAEAACKDSCVALRDALDSLYESEMAHGSC